MDEFNINDYVSLGHADFSPMFKKLPSHLSYNCQDNVIVVRKFPTGIRVASRPCHVPGNLTCMMCHCGPEPILQGIPDEDGRYTGLQKQILRQGSPEADWED